MSDEIRGWTKTCIDSNPDYEVMLMTEESGDDMVKRVFASRPDIVEEYLALPIPIFKADILRYVMLYDQGGVWSDLDISCEGAPIDEWVPEEYRETADLVVGWEFDWGWPGNFIRQFASWTIMSKKGSTHMMQVIDDIFEMLHQKLVEHSVAVENVTLEMMGDVVDFSGPRRLTTSVYKSLSKQLNQTIGEDNLSKILQPKLVGDVLVMPGRSFAASSNTYTEEEEAQMPPKLVQHHYAGSWKNDKGGED
jgi:mannosyltransferase OCH1-like enzyme